VTDDVLLTTAQRRQLERHRLIRANVQVVQVDLSSSREKYQFNKVYARRKIIWHDEEVVSGERSLWSVIRTHFPFFYLGDSMSSCKEIILFHSGEARGRQLWREGQETSSLCYYAPYLIRNHWHETPTLEGLSDGDRIEIRIAPAIDTDSESDDYGEDTIIARPRHGSTNQHTQPHWGLHNVLSQLENINISRQSDEKVAGELESSNGSNGISIQKAAWRPQDYHTPAFFYRTPAQRRQLERQRQIDQMRIPRERHIDIRTKIFEVESIYDTRPPPVFDGNVSIRFSDSFCNSFHIEFGEYTGIFGYYFYTGDRPGDSSLSADLTERVDEHTKSTIDDWIRSLFNVENLERVVIELTRRPTQPN